MPLRVGLLHLPELLADVVRSAFEPDDAEFDRLPAPETTTGADAMAGLHAVIAGVDGAWEDAVALIAAGHPRVVVLGLRTDGRQAWLYELVPQPRPLGELNRAELRSVVLEAVDSPAT